LAPSAAFDILTGGVAGDELVVMTTAVSGPHATKVSGGVGELADGDIELGEDLQQEGEGFVVSDGDDAEAS
jgi:hypothetical protein